MAHAVRAHHECLAGEQQADREELTDVAGTTPHAQASTHSVKEEDGWITFDKPVLFLFAGQGPYVSRFVIAVSSIHPLPARLAGS
jgi:sphingosine kinase